MSIEDPEEEVLKHQLKKLRSHHHQLFEQFVLLIQQTEDNNKTIKKYDDIHCPITHVLIERNKKLDCDINRILEDMRILSREITKILSILQNEYGYL